MQEILVPRVLMGCVFSFVLNSIMFFFFIWSVLRSGGATPPNHPGSVALI